MKARMGAKGRVIIPVAMRRRLGLAQGMLLDVTLEGDTLRIARAGPAPSRSEGGLPATRGPRP